MSAKVFIPHSFSVEKKENVSLKRSTLRGDKKAALETVIKANDAHRNDRRILILQLKLEIQTYGLVWVF